MVRSNVPRCARRYTTILMSLVLAVLFAGCATTISQPPFQQFSDSVQKVRTGADSTLGAIYDKARARYIDETTKGGDALQGALLTVPADDPFGWTSSLPALFLTIARFRDGVYRLNTSLVDYAAALAQLASPGLLKPETFDKLASDLNGNLRKALPALGVSDPSSKDIAIFSTAATAAFRAYLQNKQRSALAEALTTNQGAIQNASELGRQAGELMLRAVRNEYDLKSSGLANAIADAKTSTSDKRAKATELVNLNDQFIKELAALRLLYQSYITLPAAHQELARATADPKIGSSTIRQLFDEGQELQRLYESLVKQDNIKK